MESASGIDDCGRNGRAERNGKAVRAGNVGQLWDWWDRERILNSEFRIGRTGKELFSYSKGSTMILRLILLIIGLGITTQVQTVTSAKTR